MWYNKVFDAFSIFCDTSFLMVHDSPFEKHCPIQLQVYFITDIQQVHTSWYIGQTKKTTMLYLDFIIAH